MKPDHKAMQSPKAPYGIRKHLIRHLPPTSICCLLSLIFVQWNATAQTKAPENTELQILRYSNPDLVVDLGVGLWAWPLPMDFDGDGDSDLLVNCTDKPSNGIYFFENRVGNVPFPVFEAPIKIAPGLDNIHPSYILGKPRILTPGTEWVGFQNNAFQTKKSIYPSSNIHDAGKKIRANQWSYADFNGDQALDLIVGVGDWSDYGWDDAYNSEGVWTNGPLHGWVYWIPNHGSTETPNYGPPQKVLTSSGPIDTFGRPTPNLADFDSDGDLDLLCGEFLDGFTYYQNMGSATQPRYAEGQRLTYQGSPLKMHLQMIIPVAYDWDQDGDLDLVVGDEDGRVALLLNTGTFQNSIPQFLPPQYFQQRAAGIKFGALATPFGVDWDQDGDEDILCGNTSGEIAFFENLGGCPLPSLAPPQVLKTGDKTIRFQAGPNGSIQGPCEAKWGYTTLSVADWDLDGLPDILVNSIWGKIEWIRNLGPKNKPALASPKPVEVAWSSLPAPKPAWNWWNPKGNELVTQWRTTPFAIDFNGDHLTDLVMLDHEGYLAFFERSRNQDGNLILSPGQRIFLDQNHQALRLNERKAGGSGRRKIAVVDWDCDGKLDILLNSINAQWLRQTHSQQGLYYFEDRGNLDTRPLAGHTSSPTTLDWNNNQIPDLLVGAEDGYLYYKSR